MPAAPSSPQPAVSSAEKSQTARVDIPAEGIPGEAQQTQKKTIKIRRADGEAKPIGRAVNIARAEGGGVDVGGEAPAPHWAYIATASAAVVTMCVMMYALIAQVFPNLGWSLGG